MYLYFRSKITEMSTTLPLGDECEDDYDLDDFRYAFLSKRKIIQFLIFYLQ